MPFRAFSLSILISRMPDESFDARVAWNKLAKDYESSRSRVNSLDTLVEFPAQIEFVGDVKGKRLLDVGCGSGAKALYFASQGAEQVLGIDVSDVFIDAWKERRAPENLRFVWGDINALDDVSDLAGAQFDVILCLQVMGYANDRAAVLGTLTGLLSQGGRIILQSPSPIRFAVEKSERVGLPLGAAYMSGGSYAYPSGWNPEIVLVHQTPRVSDMLTSFASAGLFVNRCWEPDMSESVRQAFPDKVAWWDTYGGIVLYELVKR
jgi:2-polyprenyl-3-methyl-5-hydroxy-6-metoxy-1,4-benzoquinol methylase